jgi:phosphoglycolate phosphatase
MKFKGAIFDLDGTLLNSLEDIADSFNYSLAKYHFPIHPVSAYQYFVGDGAKDALKRALPKDIRENETVVEKLLTDFSAHYADNFYNKTKPYDGIVDMVLKLKSMNIKIAVLSNKPHRFTVQCVEKAFNEAFHFVYGVVERFPKKPDAQSTIHLIKKMGLKKSDVIYVGDTKTDMMTAKNAGITAVGVSWGFRDVKELKKYGADFIINSPNELINLN